MTNQEMVEKLEKDFPDHTFKIMKMTDPEDFKMKEFLAIDGQPPVIKWTREANYSGPVDIEEAMYGLLVGEVTTYLLYHQGKI
jgi:hypothetical protein